MVRYHAFSGHLEAPAEGGRADPAELKPVYSFSLELRLQDRGPGWRPWLDGGVGWYLANDSHPGAHLGAGLRLRDAHGHDYGLFIRRHFALQRVSEGVGSFWTAGASLALSE